MSEKYGGLSLEEIMAAASFDDTSSEDLNVEEKDKESKENVTGNTVSVVTSEVVPTVSLNNESKTNTAITQENNIVISATDDTVSLDKIGSPKETAKVRYNSNSNDLPTTNKNNYNIADPNDDFAKAEKMTEVVQTLRKFYLFDFLFRTIKARNFGLLIWLCMNFIFIEFFAILAASVMGTEYAVVGAIAGPLVYAVTLMIALSPIGEFFLRQQNSCRKIKNKNIEAKIKPIFDKVYAEAREKNPNISSNVKLFICDDESENAFATGRRTVCVTKGLVNMNEEHIAGILAHEFGHLANKDTDNLLIVVVGNLFVTIIMTVIGTILNIFGAIGDLLTENTTLGKIIPFHVFTKILSFIFVTAFMFIWTKLGALMCLRGNKKAEFTADMYAAELGYAQQLVDAFNVLDDSPAPKGLWATLTSSHPNTADRVMRLNEYIESHKQKAIK